MIRSFKHKGLRRLFEANDTRGVNAQHAAWLLILLGTLNSSTEPGDMNLPGFRLHPLKGDRKGVWAVSVSGNWRLLFEFDGTDAVHVDLVDYH